MLIEVLKIALEKKTEWLGRGKPLLPCAPRERLPLLAGELTKEASASMSTSARCLDGGDVDLLHRHHRRERTLRLTTASR